jgi:polysaccharide biosynthesis protein PslH
VSRQRRRADGRPSASVVVATHARPQFLKDCVESIAGSLGPGDELIVVESGGNDAMPALDGCAAAVSHLPSPHQGKSAKLNAGIRAARGDVVLVTDDDCRVPPEWVDTMALPFDNPAVGVAFGPARGLTSMTRGASLPPIPAGPAPPELWNYAHGASMAVRKRAVAEVGGFDERLGPGAPAHGEEGDLVLRMLSAGWTCEIADAPPVAHLDWRDDEESLQNLLIYQCGSGAYLGAGVRRDARRAMKPLALRLAHEGRRWRHSRARGRRFGPKMSTAFAAGLLHGVRLAPRRFLDAPPPETHSRERVRLLWVTDEAPDRHQGGGNIRQAMLLDGLRQRLDVTLLVVGSVQDDITSGHVTEILELPTPRRRPQPSRTLRRLRDLWRAVGRRLPSEVVAAARVRRVLEPVLDRIGEQFDVVIVHHLHVAPILPARRRAAWLLHLFDVASVRARNELSTEPGRRQRWLLARDLAKAERLEQRMAAAYDGLIVVSDQDADALTRSSGERMRGPAVIVPNGVNTSAFADGALPVEPRVVLPASLNYRPNVLGAIWFCDEVWPRVRSEVPEARFDLVGRQPVGEVLELGHRAGVEVHADVPEMRPWLTRARVVVVPLRIGSGTRLKALEAMAAGRPVVGTSIGLQGLGVLDRVHASVVDDPAAMANAIVELLNSDERAAALAAAGRRFVETTFRWEIIADRLAEVLGAAAELGPRAGHV